MKSFLLLLGVCSAISCLAATSAHADAYDLYYWDHSETPTVNTHTNIYDGYMDKLFTATSSPAGSSATQSLTVEEPEDELGVGDWDPPYVVTSSGNTIWSANGTPVDYSAVLTNSYSAGSIISGNEGHNAGANGLLLDAYAAWGGTGSHVYVESNYQTDDPNASTSVAYYDVQTDTSGLVKAISPSETGSTMVEFTTNFSMSAQAYTEMGICSVTQQGFATGEIVTP